MAKTKSKASRAEVTERVAEVLRIRLDGASFLDVCTYATEKGWNVSERQCGRYIAKADEMLAAQTEKRRRRQINLHLARRENLYARAVNAADYRTALAVLGDLAKLQNLYTSDAEIRDLIKTTAKLEQQFTEQKMQTERESFNGTARPYSPSPSTTSQATEPAAEGDAKLAR